MLTEIGTIVGRIRARRRLSVSELAVKIDSDIQVLERLEAGENGVTTTQLDAIAAALELDPQALRRGEEISRPAPSVFLRHTGMQDFHESDLEILDSAIEQSRVLNVLSTLLRLVESPRPVTIFERSAAAHDTPDAPARHGYQLATDLRKRLKIEVEPIADLRAIAEESLCVAVVSRYLSTRSAFAIKAGDAAAIVLSSSSPRNAAKTRATIAHELCHILHDPDREGVHIVVDVDNDRDAHVNEQRARAFAAELLLPRPGLNGLLGLPSRVWKEQAAKDLIAKAMDHYGASWQITANHLCNRGFIDMNLRADLEALDAHALAAVWATPLSSVGEPSLLVAKLTARAHEQGLITDGEARAALGLEAIDPFPWDESR